MRTCGLLLFAFVLYLGFMFLPYYRRIAFYRIVAIIFAGWVLFSAVRWLNGV